TVSQFTGVEPTELMLASSKLLELPPEQAVTPLNPRANPIAIEQASVVEHARAELRTLERSYFPRFYLQSSAYARGT
ncbi:hypothetical protein, partial [Klebsiella pneumoniae]|uniref:hypothetical protein n=1 Tax=Klebsiella pneumoniae TaxID=573 RepID=UPI003013D464